jgi:gamma-glutamyltranspeptidase/glutathione hydrolase
MSLSRVDTAARVFQQIYPMVAGQFANTPDSEQNSPRIFRPTTYAGIWKRASSANPLSPYADKDSREAVSEDVNGSTTHFVVVDKEGNIACVTQSLAHHFGAGVVAPGTGILLNNCMANFSYASSKAINFAQPGKRPRSTMAPTIVIENKKPLLALGSPASQRIPTGIYQVLSAVLDYNESLVDAIDEPRFHTRSRRSSSEAPNVIDLEDGFDSETATELSQLNWDVQSKSKNSYYFGGVNAVRFLPNGKREAVADDRRTNWPEGE